MRCPLQEMPHYNHISIIFEHFHGIFDRFLVKITCACHLGVRESGDMSAQAVHGGFVCQPRTGTGLIECGHQRLLCQQVSVSAAFGDRGHFIRDIENMKEFFTLEFFQ